MCLKRIQISILEGRIKRLESDIAFEEAYAEVVGESKSIDEMTAKLGRLKERLVDLQWKTDVPSYLS